MASVLDPGILLRARVYKKWVTNNDRVWSNTYEFEAQGAADINQLTAFAGALANAEASFHYNQVEFDRVVVSTIVEEANNLGEEFLTLPLSNLVGQKSPTSTGVLDLRNVLQVNFSTGLGRSGRRLYRGAIQESDVAAANSGLWGALGTTFDQTVLTAFAPMIAGTGAFVGYRPVLYSELSPNLSSPFPLIRYITGVTVKGVTMRQLRRGTSNSG
jgi:hypothetical protein